MTAARGAEEWSRELGLSREAVELYQACEVIDLHLDSFIWQRLFGYDLGRRHARAALGGWFLGHADVPRVREAGLAGATWVITTNPLREASERLPTLLDNLRALRETLARSGNDLALVRTYAEYRRARTLGQHAAFIGIQGGNALDGSDDAIERLPPLEVLRVTLVHLTSSRIGHTSSPARLAPDGGLTRFGKEFVHRLEQAKILVDLAHASPKTFWDAVDAHAPNTPLMVTHTGVSGVRRHWRNLEDAQLRAIAESGGVVGVMFHGSFIARSLFASRVEHVVDHLAHIVRVAGEETPAIGSDFDGNIIPPRELRSVLMLPRLVEAMLARGFRQELIRKILGANFLRVLARVRP